MVKLNKTRRVLIPELAKAFVTSDWNFQPVVLALGAHSVGKGWFGGH